MKLVLVSVTMFAVLTMLSGTTYAQPMKLGEVLVLHVPELKPDTDTKAFEQHVLTQVTPAWRNLHLVRADRGGRKGQYMLAWATDTEPQRQGLKSASSGSRLRERAPNFRQRLDPFVNSGGQHTEYHLIGSRNVGTLPEVEILGIHYTKVRPDKRAAFETFVGEKVHPAVANLRPDISVLFYKAVRGPDVDSYIAVFALTVASRDKYWPGGSDSNDLRAAFSPAIRELAKELSTYLVEGSYAADPKLAAAVYESREWTDFVVIPIIR